MARLRQNDADLAMLLEVGLDALMKVALVAIEPKRDDVAVGVPDLQAGRGEEGEVLSASCGEGLGLG